MNFQVCQIAGEKTGFEGLTIIKVSPLTACSQGVDWKNTDTSRAGVWGLVQSLPESGKKPTSEPLFCLNLFLHVNFYLFSLQIED